MAVQSYETKVRNGREDVRLGLTLSGMDMVVSGGEGLARGVPFSFDAPTSVPVAADATHATDVFLMMVRQDSDGEVLLLLDEIVRDGLDVPFPFLDSGMTLLHTLAYTLVPAGATALVEGQTKLFHLVPYKKEA